MNQTIDVTQLIDRQPVGRLLIGILVLCTLVTLADGYNISVAAFAGPAIVKAWGLSRASLGPLFSSSLVAGLIGPFLFGTLGDRIGRRNAIIISTLMIGVFGIVSGLCTSLIPLVITRFFAGIGMSGALAVTIAFINEIAPRRLRATLVTIVFSGTTIGSGLPGLVAGPLLAHHGWPALFFVGGVVPIILGAVVYFYLPESPKYLCLRAERYPQLTALLRRFDPQFQAAPNAQFTLGGELNTRTFSHKQFFTGKLLLLTPLLWFGAFVAQIVFHSFNSWLPTLLTDSGVPFSRASLAVALFQFVGTLGGWVIMRPVDRFGMLPCTILYAASIPIVASLGMPGLGGSALLLLCSLAGFCVLGLHFAQVSCVSNVYPTSIRALGIGWFMLFARAGGAIGPALVGFLVGRHVNNSTLFHLATLPLALGTVASIAVALVYQAHYQKKAGSAKTQPATGGLTPETTFESGRSS
jgi:AAHS family 4-hydroxybenzoate transporter-like MFS transporter